MPSTEASHPKLTSLTTATLSLLLERQRLQSTHPTLHLVQILTNLRSLRSGVIALQDASGGAGTGGLGGGSGDRDRDRDRDRDEGVAALREQYERLRRMLGEEEAERAGLESIALPEVPSPTLPATPELERKRSLEHVVFEPYTDEPRGLGDDDDDDGEGGGGIVLQQRQRQIIQDQDAHLDQLSSSINRQHHISLQINDELDVHTGLLGALDTELDGTDARMTSARRRLARVARGTRENGSTVIIALLILVLLILIVVFKT